MQTNYYWCGFPVVSGGCGLPVVPGAWGLPVESEATDVSIVTEGAGGVGSEGVIAGETGTTDWATPLAGMGLEGARSALAVRLDGLLEVSRGSQAGSLPQMTRQTV